LGVLRSACDKHIWSLFDRVKHDRFNAHGNNIYPLLDPDAPNINNLMLAK